MWFLDGEEMNWNKENTDKLRELWIEGVLSASLIGNELGCSRGSVIGKARRLKLGSREPRLTKPRGTPRGNTRVKKPELKPPPPVEFVKREAPPPEGIHIIDLEWWHCRWPKDDIMRYCGLVRAEGSYCESHAELAYDRKPRQLIRPPRWRGRS